MGTGQGRRRADSAQRGQGKGCGEQMTRSEQSGDRTGAARSGEEVWKREWFFY